MMFLTVRNALIYRNHVSICRRSSLTVTGASPIHDLWHRFASQAAMQGIPLPVVARLLGHAQVQMKLRYAHVSDRDVEAAAERIGGVMAGIMNRTPTVPEPAP